jgi:hypothetical protein
VNAARLSVAAFAALVVATVGAFFVTQHLKVTTPVIAGMSHPQPFSPGTCQPTTHISFYLLHRSDDVSVYVTDANGTIVRQLVSGLFMRSRPPIRRAFLWNGREDNGSLAPDGTYYFRVGLARQGRSIDLTGYPIVLKTVAPHPIVTRVDHALLPFGAGAVIHYAGNENRGGTIHVYRTDLPGGPREVWTFPTPWNGSQAIWDGRIHGRPAPAGTYLMGLSVTDRACNTGRFPPIVPPTGGSTAGAGVTVRYLAAQPQLDPAKAGGRATVFVDARHHPYQWSLHRIGSSKPQLAAGISSGPQLEVPLPAGGPGLYELAIRSGSYQTEAPLVASSNHPRGGILVVLPALTWQGQNVADDDGDGIPDALDAGGPVSLTRPLAAGLPAGFTDEAAFLAYLDRAHLPYDLTTDLGLIDGVGPGMFGHFALVFAGAERWVPPSLATPLKSYLAKGGRVLSLGIDSLRRAVVVQGTKASDPSAPTQADVLGAEPGPVTSHSTDSILVIRDGLGIFTGTSGAFQGFGAYQPFTGLSQPGQQILSAAGASSTTPSIIGYRFGRGIVIDVGLPGFGSSLAGSVDAQELTRRLWTILSH